MVYCGSARWWFDNKVWFIPIMVIMGMFLCCWGGFFLYKKRNEGKEVDYDIPAVGGGLYSNGGTAGAGAGGKKNPFGYDNAASGDNNKLEEDQ